nr:PREDICTED: uncharacterized protein LOC109030885 [Bemisia tabaci]
MGDNTFWRQGSAANPKMSHGNQLQSWSALAMKLALKDVWQTYTSPVNVPAPTKPEDYLQATSFNRGDRTETRPMVNPNTSKNALLTPHGGEDRATSGPLVNRNENRTVIGSMANQKNACVTPHGSEDLTTKHQSSIQRTNVLPPHGSQDLTTNFPMKKNACVTPCAKENQTEINQRNKGIMNNQSMTSYENTDRARQSKEFNRRSILRNLVTPINQDLTTNYPTKKNARVTSCAKENQTEINRRNKGIMNNHPMTSLDRTRQSKEFNRRSILRNLVTPIVCTILLSSFCVSAVNPVPVNDVTSRLAKRALGVDPILTKADEPKGIPKTLPSLGYDLKGDCDVIALEERWLDAHILSSYDESESLVLRPANIRRVGLMHFKSNCSFDKSEIVCYGKMLTPLRAKETSGVCSIEIPSLGRVFSFPLLKREV